MAQFKFTPNKMITFDRYVVKFDEEGLYTAEKEDEIKGLKSFEGVEEVKPKK